MKKYLLLGAFVFALSLSACGKNETVSKQDIPSVQPIASAEYQFHVRVEALDNSGNQQVLDMNVYQKGTNSLHIINEMPLVPGSPLVTKKALILSGIAYIQMEVSGELFRFKADGFEQTQLSDQLFDLKLIQNNLAKKAESSAEETINGQKMICYFEQDEIQETKSCTANGIFAYSESKSLNSPAKSVITVTNYLEAVDESLFVAPDQTKDMMELMEMVMGGEK